MSPGQSTMCMGLSFSVAVIYFLRLISATILGCCSQKDSAETMPKIQFSAIFKSKYSYIRFSDVFPLKPLPIVITLGPAHIKLQ